MSTQLLEAPPVPVGLPPSREVADHSIKDAKEKGYITALGADALRNLRPELVQMVVERSKSLGQPPKIGKH